ncbi:MAG: sugar phosphate isomerase/epimerase [Kiritimatiellaeota bacterium]|nr:sugar phosphate isomerase/epimerase [Kiritimatiellota bacterium]
MFTRRHFCATAVVVAGAGCARPMKAQEPIAFGNRQQDGDARFRFCLNTGTIRGYKLPLDKQIEAAVATGYGGIEPWVSDVAEAAKTGGALKGLAKRCKDGGLAVVSAIGFAPWAVNEDDVRAKGLEQMKREMAMIAELGGTHIAAPPAGINGGDAPVVSLDAIAERYRAVLELGRDMGVVPQIEFWGSAKNLNRLEQCIYVAAMADHPDACVLADVFHAYKGGSSFNALRLLGREAAHCFHINDYPANPPRETIRDADRVWPGDGIAPLKEVIASFRDNRADVWLSVEVFNAAYWKTSAEETAKTGLANMRKLVSRAE